MESSFLTYSENDVDQFESPNKWNNNYIMRIDDQGGIRKITLTFTEEQIQFLRHNFSTQNILIQLKEDYLFTLINNLLKKNEFLQLTIELLENQISEEEFEEEIENNSDKYLIETFELITTSDLNIITNILKRIGKSFSIDEVAELFSIEPQSLNRHIKSLI